MIRLSSTSISLSDKDLQFHLQQIAIYHSLLRQGFKKREIIHYFNEHRALRRQADDLIELVESEKAVEGLGAPSCVELALRSGEQPEASTSGATKAKEPTEDDGQEVMGSDFEEVTNDFRANALQSIDDTLPTNNLVTDKHGQTYKTRIVPSVRDATASDFPTITNIQRHLPRKSSLLRYAESMSPGKVRSDTEITSSPPMTLQQPSLVQNRRSQTEPYYDNEKEDVSESLDRRLGSLGISDHEDLSQIMKTRFLASSYSALRPEAKAFVPQNLPSAVVDMNRLSSNDGSDDANHSSPGSVIQDESHSTLISPFASPLSRDDPARTPSIHASLPSSPPEPISSSSTSSSDSIALPSMSNVPATPTPNSPRVSVFRTEPRGSLQHYQDGRSFRVYNETLPANTQPETPADLSRRPLITEQDAAYTAPPGVLRNSTMLQPRDDLHEWQDRQAGEQSPTVRALGIRERRLRELLRSVRVHGSLRRDRQDGMRRGFDGNDEDGPGNTRRRIVVEPEVELINAWRDELEGDRVGEENFEVEVVVRRDAGIRVISGNARMGD